MNDQSLINPEILGAIVGLVWPGLVAMHVYRLIIPAGRIDWSQGLLQGFFFTVINYLLTFPLVLGPGKRLFGAGTRPGALKLAQTTVSTTGVIMSVYDRAGAISTGSFQQADPSPAEVARQARMMREG